jgi:hypothetical protein
VRDSRRRETPHFIASHKANCQFIPPRLLPTLLQPASSFGISYVTSLVHTSYASSLRFVSDWLDLQNCIGRYLVGMCAHSPRLIKHNPGGSKDLFHVVVTSSEMLVILARAMSSYDVLHPYSPRGLRTVACQIYDSMPYRCVYRWSLCSPRLFVLDN